MRTTMKLENYDTLDCPSCGRGCAPRRVNADESVSYKCAGSNHAATHGRDENWRISKDGNLQLPNDAGRYVQCVPGSPVGA